MQSNVSNPAVSAVVGLMAFTVSSCLQAVKFVEMPKVFPSSVALLIMLMVGHVM
jgi:hypothetical protein